MDIIVEGSKRASERAAETMDMVRGAISLDYRKLFAEIGAPSAR